MSGHSLFNRLFGIIDVKEDADNISITGVKTQSLAQEIMREWSTSRIESQMFLKFTRDRIVFPKFFAVELVYMLERILLKRSVRDRRSLRTLRDELLQHTWLAKIDEPWTSKLDYGKLSLFVKKPLPHQSEFFQVYDERTQRFGLYGYLLNAAAGSGKTLMDLMLAEMLHAEQLIIIAPKNSIYRVWDDTLRNEYRKPCDVWIPDAGGAYEGQKYIVVHYEAQDKVLDPKVLSRIQGKKTAVVLDESHNMNTPDSLRTLTFLDICVRTFAKDIIFASGTPIKAMGYESIPLMRAIDPLFTPVVEERFKKIYGKTASRALDILAHRMGMVTHTIAKGEVMDNKPTDHELLVKLPNGKDYTLKAISAEMQEFIERRMSYYKSNFAKYRGIYDQAIEVFEATLRTPKEKEEYREYQRTFAEICKGYDPRFMAALSTLCNRYELTVIAPTLPRDLKVEFLSARSVIKYVDLKVMGEALGGVLGKKRMQCHLDMVERMGIPDIVDGSMKKTVIFSSYVQVVEKIANYLRDKDYAPSVVHGETNKDLPEIIERFGKVPQVNPLVATFQSLSTAVPLVMANTAIMTNQPWRDGEMLQARARIDRLSQDTPVHFYNVLLDTGGEPNISTRSLDILEWSRKQVEAIMGKSMGEVAVESLDEEQDIIALVGNRLAFEALVDELTEEAETQPQPSCEEGESDAVPS
jgi:hypothetical protein